MWAAEVALCHEELVASGLPRLRMDFHERMAAAHRRTEECHLVASRIHLDYAQRLERWAQDDTAASRPQLVMAVAGAAGSQSATLNLRGRCTPEALIATSDGVSRSAYRLERAFAEGPSRDAIKEPAPILASGSDLPVRWPQYGPALRELGVQMVAAVGLCTAEVCLGSLTVFDPQLGGPGKATAELSRIATAVVHSVLLDPDAVGSSGDLPRLTQFEKDDFQPVLHQAAGRVHADCGCGVDTALALIRSRAFSEELPVESVAQDVVRGVLKLP
jgi:hypothetical protein